MHWHRFWRQCWRCRREHPAGPTWRQLWNWFPAWRASFAVGRGSLVDERPWITFGAVEFLESRWGAESHVFEWGSGGSSLYFARRSASVVSVEHDAEWFERVRSAIHTCGLTNWRGILVPPEPAPADWEARSDDCDGYVSDAEEFRGCYFQDYVSQIDAFADESFDVVLIDGRARPSCLKHALRKVRSGGCLVWDNSERDYYFPAMRLVPDNFQRFDFPGPGPYVSGFWRTTVFVHRPARRGRSSVSSAAATDRLLIPPPGRERLLV